MNADGERYWTMRGALCMERIRRAHEMGFDTSADGERELLHVEHMMGDEKWRLDPFYCHPRKDGETTVDWMRRAEDEYLAEITADPEVNIDELAWI